MTSNFENCLVVGISSRALFDLEVEDKIFRERGLKEYSDYQINHENDILKPGPGFPLVKAMLKLNDLEPDIRRAEVIVMSRNSADTSLRISKSIEHYKLDITRVALSGGAHLSPYLSSFNTDLFLSADEGDVQAAINSDIAAGIICTDHVFTINPEEEIQQIRIAFDGDAVIFSDESEKIYKAQGLQAFVENERINANNPLSAGPFAKLLETISSLQADFEPNEAPIRTALVTSRSILAQERVIRTLREWDVRIDEAFFLGGLQKSDILSAFGAHIFFDDQAIHTEPASEFVPAARVPYKAIID